jgi:hypothetical protein
MHSRIFMDVIGYNFRLKKPFAKRFLDYRRCPEQSTGRIAHGLRSTDRSELTRMRVLHCEMEPTNLTLLLPRGVGKGEVGKSTDQRKPSGHARPDHLSLHR